MHRALLACLDELLAPETLTRLCLTPIDSVRLTPFTGGHSASGAAGTHCRSAARHVPQRAPETKAINSRSGRRRARGVQLGIRSSPAITALQPP